MRNNNRLFILVAVLVIGIAVVAIAIATNPNSFGTAGDENAQADILTEVAQQITPEPPAQEPPTAEPPTQEPPTAEPPTAVPPTEAPTVEQQPTDNPDPDGDGIVGAADECPDQGVNVGGDGCPLVESSSLGQPTTVPPTTSGPVEAPPSPTAYEVPPTLLPTEALIPPTNAVPPTVELVAPPTLETVIEPGGDGTGGVIEGDVIVLDTPAAATDVPPTDVPATDVLPTDVPSDDDTDASLGVDDVTINAAPPATLPEPPSRLETYTCPGVGRGTCPPCGTSGGCAYTMNLQLSVVDVTCQAGSVTLRVNAENWRDHVLARPFNYRVYSPDGRHVGGYSQYLSNSPGSARLITTTFQDPMYVPGEVYSFYVRGEGARNAFDNFQDAYGDESLPSNNGQISFVAPDCGQTSQQVSANQTAVANSIIGGTATAQAQATVVANQTATAVAQATALAAQPIQFETIAICGSTINLLTRTTGQWAGVGLDRDVVFEATAPNGQVTTITRGPGSIRGGLYDAMPIPNAGDGDYNLVVRQRSDGRIVHQVTVSCPAGTVQVVLAPTVAPTNTATPTSTPTDTPSPTPAPATPINVPLLVDIASLTCGPNGVDYVVTFEGTTASDQYGTRFVDPSNNIQTSQSSISVPANRVLQGTFAYNGAGDYQFEVTLNGGPSDQARVNCTPVAPPATATPTNVPLLVDIASLTCGPNGVDYIVTFEGTTASDTYGSRFVDPSNNIQTQGSLPVPANRVAQGTFAYIGSGDYQFEVSLGSVTDQASVTCTVPTNSPVSTNTPVSTDTRTPTATPTDTPAPTATNTVPPMILTANAGSSGPLPLDGLARISIDITCDQPGAQIQVTINNPVADRATFLASGYAPGSSQPVISNRYDRINPYSLTIPFVGTGTYRAELKRTNLGGYGDVLLATADVYCDFPMPTATLTPTPLPADFKTFTVATNCSTLDVTLTDTNQTSVAEIDWGDGSGVEVGNGGDTPHTYAQAGTYTITYTPYDGITQTVMTQPVTVPANCAAPAATNTPVPTNTPLPTNTPVPTNTPTATLIPTTTPSSTPIPPLTGTVTLDCNKDQGRVSASYIWQGGDPASTVQIRVFGPAGQQLYGRDESVRSGRFLTTRLGAGSGTYRATLSHGGQLIAEQQVDCLAASDATATQAANATATQDAVNATATQNAIGTATQVGANAFATATAVNLQQTQIANSLNATAAANASNTGGTATTVANQINATSTAVVATATQVAINLQATADANATATQVANATATQDAVNATATQNAMATATQVGANAFATATAVDIQQTQIANSLNATAAANASNTGGTATTVANQINATSTAVVGTATQVAINMSATGVSQQATGTQSAANAQATVAADSATQSAAFNATQAAMTGTPTPVGATAVAQAATAAPPTGPERLINPEQCTGVTNAPAEVVAAMDRVLLDFTNPSPELLAALEPLQIQQPNAVGAILLVQSPDWIYYEATGLANRETGDLMNCLQPSEIGSTTKMMTMAVILQLQEAGLLNIDDPLSQYLPEYAAAFPNGDQITLRQLANHTSGLWDYGGDVGKGGIIADGIDDEAALERSYTPDELVQYAIANGEPYFEPGAEGKWHYSNTNYALLGIIIENLTGQKLEDVFQERIFTPLGMDDTFLWNGVPEADMGLPRGYQGNLDYRDMTQWNLSQGWAAGGVISTAEDMTTFIRALVTGELFQNADTLSIMQESVPAFDLLAQYGLGLLSQAPNTWGHNGDTLGYETVAVYNTTHGVSIVILTNTQPNLAQLGTFITTSALAELGYAEAPVGTLGSLGP